MTHAALEKLIVDVADGRIDVTAAVAQLQGATTRTVFTGDANIDIDRVRIPRGGLCTGKDTAGDCGDL